MTITNKVSLKSVMAGNTPIADVPDGPAVSTITNTSFDGSVTVAATAAATGGTPTTFTITPTPTTSPATFTGASPVTVSGLSDGTSYTFTAAGVNSTATGPAGSASSSFTPVVSGSYFSIATVIPSASSIVTFSSIPQTYTHLQLRYIAKTAWAPGATADVLPMRLNGDTTTGAHRFHSMYSGVGPSVSVATGSYTYFGDSFAASASNLPASTFGAGVFDILDYTNTNKNKTVLLMSGVDSNNYYTGNFWGAALSSGVWLNTAAITSITLLSNNANFAAGSHFALYGVMA